MSYTESSYDEYLYKKVTIKCDDGQSFSGVVCSYGCSVDGKEEYGIEEPYIELDTGGSITVLFEHDIESIQE